MVAGGRGHGHGRDSGKGHGFEDKDQRHCIQCGRNNHTSDKILGQV